MSAELLDYLARHAVDSTHDDRWQPSRFRLGDPDSLRALDQLRQSGAIHEVRDELHGQLVNLLETQHPSSKLSAAELDALVAEKLGDVPESHYGEWIYYPWSQRLVHALPEAEYRELRTSRNRNKITFEEQEALARLRIGIIGLSIGQAAALTLTLEGVGGFLALADFDHLELSNMNRLRTGVHTLGVNKAVLAAREVYEINPYAQVALWTDGITSGNIEAFLHQGDRKLDLVYEECDDLQMKLMVREHAKGARVPVLMETSDKGLIDIERFDLEPERPIFHGLVGDVKAEELTDMSTYDKVPIVMRIIGQHGMSARFAASMVDIESTLKSWPQLASEVALGSGINVDVARRIALDQLKVSGRFYVDLEELVSESRLEPVDEPPSYAIEISPQAHSFDLPELVPAATLSEEEAIKRLVAWGTTAFSGGNIQPWQLTYGDARLSGVHDVERSRSFLDADDRASYLAFGSLIETLELTAKAMGLEPSLTLFPDPDAPRHIFDLTLIKAVTPPEVDPLVAHVPNRVTNRRLGERKPLADEHRRALMREIEASPCSLQLLEDDEALAGITRVIGGGDRVRMLSQAMHTDMMGEMRWSRDEVERTRDGIDVATLEMTPPEVAGMRMISNWSVMKTVGVVGGGLGLERPTRKATAAASAVGVLITPDLSPKSFVAAGRALQRLWLTATSVGLSLQPMTTLAYMFYRLEHMDGEGFSAKERQTLGKLREEYRRYFDVGPNQGEPMIFRLAYAPPPTARSLRRTVEDVLTFRRD